MTFLSYLCVGGDPKRVMASPSSWTAFRESYAFIELFYTSVFNKSSSKS